MSDTKTLQYAAQSWPNEGIPLSRDSNLYTLLDVLSQPYEETDETGILIEGTTIIDETTIVEYESPYGKLGTYIETVDNNIHVNTATKASLEKFGELVGVSRRTNETHLSYRIRIKTAFRGGTTGTTLNDTLQFISTLLDVDVEQIGIERVSADEPLIVVRIDGQALDSLEISQTDFISLINEVIPASHRIDVVQRGTFRVRGAAETNDPSKGLIAAGETDGGTLASGSL